MRRWLLKCLCSAGLALAAFAAMAKLLQCPSCGTEYEEGGTACAHCGKALPAAKVEAAPVAAPAASLDGAVLDREIASVRQAAAAGNAGLAIERARNTLALLEVGPESQRAQSAALLQILTAAEKKIREKEKFCFACKGTGHRTFVFSGMSGSIRSQSTPEQGCIVCGGSGTLKGLATSAEIVSLMARAEQAYNRDQQARNWEEVGGIWVPRGVMETLDLNDRTALKKAAAKSCPSCHGFGRYGCASCEGCGKLKCSNTKCIMGQEPCPTCKGKGFVATVSTGRTGQRGCQACGKSGVSTCTTCSGRAHLECKKCSARGEEVCAACKGTGELPPCKKCDGAGLVDCRSCKGTGEIRGAPCPDCKGGKQAACTSCNGTGRYRR